MINAVVLISGFGSNLQAIIDQCHNQTINIKAVIADRPAEGLKRAREIDIPYRTIMQMPDENAEEYSDRLSKVIDLYEPDMIILAGFMRILQPNLIQKYPNKILNIHPSLLPKFKGLHTHERVLESGDTMHGMTIHLVTNELDSGPIILQKCFRVLQDDDVTKLEEKVHKLEHLWYPEVINLLARWQTAIQTLGHNT